MPKFSIIIPVYNVEKYLVECLESIVNQSFKNFEFSIPKKKKEKQVYRIYFFNKKFVQKLGKV